MPKHKKYTDEREKAIIRTQLRYNTHVGILRKFKIIVINMVKTLMKKVENVKTDG